MTVPGNIDALLLGGQRGYQIERSLRFNSADSASLTRTPASAGNRRTWTWSGWVKRTAFASSQAVMMNTDGADRNGLYFNFTASDTLQIGDYTTGFTWQFVTTQVFRDPSAWFHVVFAFDSTQATSSDRAKLYVNGSQVTALSTASYPSLNYDSFVNTTSAIALGRLGGTNAWFFNGYLTEINFIDGQALTPSSFGETDTITGVWKPKKYAGTYGTNGFYLKFADNSGTTSTTLGKDSSGNGNNWTPNNFSVTAGAGNDSLIDTPTPYADGGNGRGNYATLNPLDANGGNFFNGNLEYAGVFSTFSSQNGHGCRSTLRVRPSGKWYVEAANVTYSGSGNSCMLGFTSSTQAFTATAFGGTLTPWIGVDASVFNNRITLQWNGVSGGTASATQLFASYASGDVVNFAIDFDAGKFWVGKNGTWYNSGNPAAGTNATSTFTVGSSDWAFWGEYVAAGDNSNRSSVLVNFGQRSFSSTPPSGFLALNTQNLPEPSIKKPSSYFDAKLYTGNGGTQTISGLEFSPDLAWIKSRSNPANGFYHHLVDAVRGSNGGFLRTLYSNTTEAEDTYPGSTYGGIISLNANGFSLANAGANTFLNNNTTPYVAWCWDESATPGFDIVTYTGNGTNNRAINHGLGVTPAFIVVKDRTNTFNWDIYHQSLGINATLTFTTDATRNLSAFGTSAPTSTQFFTQNNYTNTNAANLVAYLWSEVAGFSKFGSYTGNGSTDGPFVFCGFRPRFIMIKNSTNSGVGYSWFMYDSARNTFNITTESLLADSSSATYTDPVMYIDVLSNGFKIRGTAIGINNSSATMVFAAFAESPLKYSLAR